jgi:hypothetical protein
MTPPKRRRLHPLLGTPLFGVALFAAYAVATVGVALVAAVDLARTDRPIAAETLIAWSQDHILLAAFITALAAIPVTLKLGGWLAGLDRGDLGLAPGGARRALVVGLVLGLGAMLVPALLGRTVGWMVPATTASHAAIGAAALPGIAFAVPALLAMAFGEELLVRGFLLRYWQPTLGIPGAILLSSVAFSLMHLSNPNLSGWGLLGIFIAGVMLAAAFVASGSLWFVTGIHLGWNAATSLVLGLPVSGLVLPSLARWQTADSATAQQLMGGDFGPEEGLLFHLGLTVTMAAALLVAPLLRSEATSQEASSEEA